HAGCRPLHTGVLATVLLHRGLNAALVARDGREPDLDVQPLVGGGFPSALLDVRRGHQETSCSALRRRFSATSFSHASTACAVSISNSKRAVMSSLTSAAST